VGGDVRGELVAYDAKSQRWLPYLSGLSAEGVSFSRDGEWVAYITFPEGALWRSKPDGSERMQLTYRPLRAYQPWWSPDGKQIAFMGIGSERHWHIYLLSAQGGSAEQLTSGANDQTDPSWSADGKSLAFGDLDPQDPNKRSIRLLDLKTRNVTEVAGSREICCPRWSSGGRYMAGISFSGQDLMLFDFKTQKWQMLAKETINFMMWSRDGKTLYFDTFLQSNPAFYRVRTSDFKVERLVPLGSLRRANGIFGPWAGLTLDDSPLTLRDVGAQDIYALDVNLPYWLYHLPLSRPRAVGRRRHGCGLQGRRHPATSLCGAQVSARGADPKSPGLGTLPARGSGGLGPQSSQHLHDLRYR